jgi:hypothetical protein
MIDVVTSMQLALFGESDVGKSHYGAQLLSRIEAEACELKLREPPEDISPFDEVRKRLNAGLLADHTPSGVYRESVWAVEDGQGNDFDLIWPDYAGEQIRQLIDTRRMGQEWLARTQNAHGWILMVRPNLSRQDDDIFSRPLGDLRRSQGRGAENKPHRTVQARLVELLQLLLHARGLADKGPNPPMAVLLSCWDELAVNEGVKPEDVLNQTLPLLASFIRSRWGDRCVIFGLSALGTELNKDTANEQFVNHGPERFGFVVGSDGSRVPDLTSPIIRLAAIARQ